MRKLRILFIVAGLVGAFYLNGASSLTQASTSPCYRYSYYVEGGCQEFGHNCEDGSGGWCERCDGYLHCYLW
jgi:hypothetical protein